jgi:hypothetical protein
MSFRKSADYLAEKPGNNMADEELEEDGHQYPLTLREEIWPRAQFIRATELDANYLNELIDLSIAFQNFIDSVPPDQSLKQKAIGLARKFPTYVQDVCATYGLEPDDLFSQKNFRAILRLDEIVDEIHKLFDAQDDDNAIHAKLGTLFDEVNKLIRGKDRPAYKN